MSTFRGKRVSAPWATILQAATNDGVRFTLNSGQRTIAEQQRLRTLYLQGRGNLAAVPSCSAPHIMCGSVGHALDVNQLDGGAGRLAGWLVRNGVRVVFNVPGEPWHMFPTSATVLQRVAGRLEDPLAGYTASERRWIREYDDLRRRGRGRTRRTVLRRVMTRQRRAIWHAAQGAGGWTKANRRNRYVSLHARTR